MGLAQKTSSAAPRLSSQEQIESAHWSVAYLDPGLVSGTYPHGVILLILMAVKDWDVVAIAPCGTPTNHTDKDQYIHRPRYPLHTKVRTLWENNTPAARP